MIFRFIYCLSLSLIGLQPDVNAQIRPTERFEQWEKTLVFSLALGDHFENDSAGIYIDGTAFFRNVKLTSNPSDGCADLIVDIHKNERGVYQAGIFRKDSISIRPLPELISVKVVFNGKPYEYSINPKNGKYALFEKEGNGQLSFRQSHRQPTFE